MALRAPAPLPAAGRGTISRCPLIGLPPLAACYSTYLSCTRACFAFAERRTDGSRADEIEPREHGPITLRKAYPYV